MAEIESAGVDRQGLMKVLADHLYSTPEVVVRELVQNAHDSCVRRRLEGAAVEPAVRVLAQPDAGRLVIRDNGAGLTRDEITRYLATIGAGFTRVLREQHGDGALIGAFGLGFLSAYAVSDRVEVRTTSHLEPSVGHVFRSRDGLSFTVDEVEPGEPGTEVILTLSRKHADLCDPGRVRDLVERYCRLLPVPVFAPDRVNGLAPAWREDLSGLHPARASQRWRETAATFERRYGTLAAFPLAPTEGVDARGVVWIHDGASWATSDHRGVTVFVRGMMVTEDARELLPDWAGFTGAAVESSELVPTASREDLQRDHRWQRLRDALRTTLVSGLTELARREVHTWRRVVVRHNDALLGAALSDPGLFALLRDELQVPTSEGPLAMPEIARRSGGRIAIRVGDDSGYEQLLHRALGRPVVDGTRFGAAALAARWSEASGVPTLVLGTGRADAEVFPRARVDPSTVARLRELLGEEDLEVVASRFAPDVVPLVLVPDREVLLKRRIEDDEADLRIGAGLLALARGFTTGLADGASAKLYVNLDSPAVQRMLAAPPERARHAATILKATADLTARNASEELARDLPAALRALGEAVAALLGP